MNDTDTLLIELVYDPDCPNVDGAREAIREALGILGASSSWREWDRSDMRTPPALRTLGSPSVLVNGRDIGCDETEATAAEANSCRIYTDASGCICGAPTSQLILNAVAMGRK